MEASRSPRSSRDRLLFADDTAAPLAAAYLALAGDPGAVDRLVAMTRDARHPYAGPAVAQLALLGHPSAVAATRRLLKARKLDTVALAVDGAGALGTPLLGEDARTARCRSPISARGASCAGVVGPARRDRREPRRRPRRRPRRERFGDRRVDRSRTRSAAHGGRRLGVPRAAARRAVMSPRLGAGDRGERLVMFARRVAEAHASQPAATRSIVRAGGESDERELQYR